jgi:outer membrane immunogenic protein
MKKILLSCAVVCAAFICSNNEVFAQTSKTRLGIKAGIDYMTLGAGYNSRPGFQGGLFLETPISDQVSFSPQLLYTQKGSNIEKNVFNNLTVYKVEGKTQLDYLDLPLLFALKTKPFLIFFIGPQVSFLLSRKTTAIVSGVNSSSTTSTDDLREILLGGNVGLGGNLSNNISLNVNYLFDFQRTTKGSTDSGEKNRGFAFTVGCLF